MDDLAARVRDVLKGDAEAFNPIVEAFQDMAVSYATAILRDVHLAEDAAQNSFVTAFMNLESLADPAAFPGWMKRIVFTECTRIRRKAKPEVLTLDYARMMSDDPDPAEDLDESERKAEAEALIESLPDRAQGVTILYYLAGMSQKEIAEFLHVAEGTVKKRLHDARQRMRSNVAGRTRRRQSSRIGRAFVVGTTVSAAEAIAKGDAEKLRSLIKANPSLVHVKGALDFRYNDGCYFTGATLLHLMCGHPTPYNPIPENVLELMDIVLDAGADPDAMTEAGYSMLNLICWRVPRAMGVMVGAVDLLCRYGADPDLGMPRTPLENAILHGEKEGGDAIHRHGARIDLRLAAGLGRRDLMDGFFNADGSLTSDAYDLAPPVGEGCKKEVSREEVLASAISTAIMTWQFDAIEYLLERGADINAYGSLSHGGPITPLHMACFMPAKHRDEWGEPGMVEFLLERGADPTIRDAAGPGATPFQWGIQNGHWRIVTYMLERGAWDGSLDEHLRHAAGQGHREQKSDFPHGIGWVKMAEAFLEAGADPHARPEGKPSAVEIAKRTGCREMVKVLGGR